jgi:hypothetical protein
MCQRSGFAWSVEAQQKAAPKVPRFVFRAGGSQVFLLDLLELLRTAL